MPAVDPLDNPALDNPAWHALTGPQQTLAEGDDRARRYPDDVGVFAAIPDEPETEHWSALRHFVGPATPPVLMRTRIDEPPGWTAGMRLTAVQMTAGAVPPPEPFDFVALGDADVPEMLDLVRRTAPGPFGPRTIALGTYLGVRDGGRLVAMAGERMRPPGYTEISAVCTDPEHRGRGFARALVCELVDRIAGRGERAFLHATNTNTAAIRLYESLGFVVRSELTAVAFVATSDDAL
jgi:ribosomal protein S18 acetylase RimI-like enzyme